MIPQPTDITEGPYTKRLKSSNHEGSDHSTTSPIVKRPNPVLQKILFYREKEVTETCKRLRRSHLKAVRRVHAYAYKQDRKRKEIIIPKLCRSLKSLKGLSFLSL